MMNRWRNAWGARVSPVQWMAAVAVMMFVATVGATPPEPLKTQAPGFFRQTLGAMEVTALYDGFVDLKTQLIQGLPQAQVQRLVARSFQIDRPGIQTAVNAYLIHTGQRLVLIDTGASQCFGAGLGEVLENLKASGYAPESIDTVLLTHMHPDHLCGLRDAQGRTAFPNATVWAAAEDAAFWLDEAVAAAAPVEHQRFFAMAREAVAPYQTTGRLKTFKAGESLGIAGIQALPSHGHTPGHTSYLLGEGKARMLVWGDIVHYHAVQFNHPEASFEYDTEPRAAIASRKALLKQAARQQWWVAGAHLPFPGIGHVRPEAKGYTWVPVEFGPLR